MIRRRKTFMFYRTHETDHWRPIYPSWGEERFRLRRGAFRPRYFRMSEWGVRS